MLRTRGALLFPDLAAGEDYTARRIMAPGPIDALAVLELDRSSDGAPWGRLHVLSILVVDSAAGRLDLLPSPVLLENTHPGGWPSLRIPLWVYTSRGDLRITVRALEDCGGFILQPYKVRP